MARSLRLLVALSIASLLAAVFIVIPSPKARAVPSPNMTLVFDVAAGDTITLPLQNPVNVSIVWGDGITDSSLTHTYDSAGSFVVYVMPDDINSPMTATGFGNGSNTWGGNGDLGGADKLINVVDWGVFGSGFVSLSGAFQYANRLNTVPSDIPSSVTDLSYLLANSTRTQIGYLSDWITTNVTNMEKLAYNCPNFNNDLSGWDTEHVVNMDFMFSYAHSFNNGEVTNYSLNPMNWNVSSVTTMKHMFDGASSFNQDISLWNTHHVHFMDYMFQGAESFNQDLSAWDTSGVSDFTGMFAGATQFNNGEEPGEYTNPLLWQINTAGTVDQNPVNLNYMFSRAEAFNQDLSDWNVSHVTSMAGMFSGAELFNQDLSLWDVSNVTSMAGMFDTAQSFNQDLSDWFVTNVESTRFMFHDASAFNNGDSENNEAHPLNWQTTALFDMEMMFSGAESFNQPLPNWDTSATNGDGETLIGGMFHEATLFDQDISDWDMSNVHSFAYEDDEYTYGMFEGARAFNQDISGWATNGVTNFTGMFSGATNFNNGEEPGESSNPLSWQINTARTVVLDFMFEGARAFNQDISDWNVSQITSFPGMFADAESFNQDISGWDMSNATDISVMFWGAAAFDQDLSQWDVSSVEDAFFMLLDSGMSIENYTNTLIGWSQLPLVPETYFTINQYYLPSAEDAHAAFASLWDVDDLGPAPSPEPPTPPTPSPTPSPSVSPSPTQSSNPAPSSSSLTRQSPEFPVEVPSLSIQSEPETSASTTPAASEKTASRQPQTGLDPITISIAAGATLLAGSASVAGIQQIRRRRLKK